MITGKATARSLALAKKVAYASASAANLAETLASQQARFQSPRHLRRSHRAALAAAVRAAEGERADALWMRERELLGDHPAHRDAENVCRIDFEGIEQPQGVRGELDDREWLLHPAALP